MVENTESITPKKERSWSSGVNIVTHLRQSSAAKETTLGDYLIQRLADLGVGHVFGIPGDYVLGFMKKLEASPIELVGTTNELCAGYAADAYARIRGLGVACVTYAVGAFSLANAIAGAYAEKSPVLIISGAPGVRERRRKGLLHHMVGDAGTQLRVFQQITAASSCLDDPLTAAREIDRVLATCLRTKQPVYLEIPRDKIDMAIRHDHHPIDEAPQSDPDELAEAIGEASWLLGRSAKPVMLAGIEVHRFGLEPEVLAFAEKHKLPVASTLLSKSVVPERHPLYVGTYMGGMGRPEMTRFIEDSDQILLLGVPLTDLDTGIFTHHLAPERTIYATGDSIRIRHHTYQHVLLGDFLRGLAECSLPTFKRTVPVAVNPINAPWKVESPKNPVVVQRLFQKINQILGPNHAVITDPGDAMFGAADLSVHQGSEFLGSAFYATLGWAVPAAIGVQIANSNIRPIVLVGDGAFQMTGMELSTAVRRGLNPIVVLFNNKGYLTERFILEGKFNDIQDWAFHKLPEVLKGGKGFEVNNEGELEAAFTEALACPDQFCLIHVHLAADDYSPALRRLAEALSKEASGKG
jgi:indolepyruvate decarboxylase